MRVFISITQKGMVVCGDYHKRKEKEGCGSGTLQHPYGVAETLTCDPRLTSKRKPAERLRFEKELRQNE